jgi:hypothetical protein
MRWHNIFSKRLRNRPIHPSKSRQPNRRCVLERLDERRLLTVNWLVNTLSDSPGHVGLSLRDAVVGAAESSDDDLITFDPAMFDGQQQEINLSGSVTIGNFNSSGDITIEGPGANQLAINAEGADSVFSFALNVSSMYNVTIDGLTLTGATGSAIEKNFPGVKSLTLFEDEISGNTGSAISWSTGGELSITNSTIANNQTDGAPVLDLNQLGSASTLTNDTIADNSSAGPVAGINIQYGTVTLQNVTVADNHADLLSDGVGAGINLAAPCSVTLLDSIVAANSAGTSDQTVAADTGMSLTVGAANFTVASTYNLIGYDVSGSFPPGTGNLIGTDPNNSIYAGLGPLGYYGGTTQTLALFDNSPAIDAGSPTALSTTDQRGSGFSRAIDGNGDGIVRADIGAFETGNVDPLNNSLTVLFHPGAAVTVNEQEVTVGTSSLSLSGASTLNLVGDGGAYTIAPTLADSPLPSTIMINDPAMTTLTLDFSATDDAASINEQTINTSGSSGTTSISYSNGSAGLSIIPGSSQTITSHGPLIINFKFEEDLGIWSFSGMVVDDQSVAGLTVTFGGLLTGYFAEVDSDGTFDLLIPDQTGAYGTVTAVTVDWAGLPSNVVSVFAS